MMDNLPKIYADFQKLDDSGKLILSCAGTVSDIRDQRIKLVDGLKVIFYSDDEDEDGRPTKLMINGTIGFDSDSKAWVGTMDESGFFYGPSSNQSDL